MISPLDILSAPSAPAPARKVNAEEFAQLCEAPGAQRYIIDDSAEVSGVYLDGVDYRRA